MSELLQYRFPATDDPDAPGAPGLGGHAVGNLLIAAMTASRAATSRRASGR